MIANLLGHLHEVFARSRLLTWAAVKLRNQASCVISHAVAPSWQSPRQNGEYNLLHTLHNKVERFVDVGANIGDWTREMLSIYPNAKGILLDPNPEAVSVLEARFAACPGIVIVKAAASEREGRSRFYCEKMCGGGSSVVSGATAFAESSFVVETVRLDHVLSKYGWSNVSFVKIDAEGHDFSVIKDLKDSLKNHAVELIQFEYNSAWALNGSTIGHCIQWLEELGYQTKLIQPKRLVKFNYAFYGEYFRYSNFVAGTIKTFDKYGLIDSSG